MTVKLATDRRAVPLARPVPADQGPVPAERSLRLFTGNANRPLAEAICAELGIHLGDASVEQFAAIRRGDELVVVLAAAGGCDGETSAVLEGSD
ncbi:MAG TPA: ribose-phosphate pyrophosphokinase-like domain-containing protein, partial [Acidobacteriota bacterium]|nr:ribose-phosphate pyrophosphokinase-like domain-containing protein [Acidobacteriota bacterium]